jgi:hypothetical protein
MATPIETRIINKALMSENYLDITYTGMYSEFDKLIVKVRDDRTHVFIASDFAMNFFVQQSDIFGHTIHIARHQYFDKPFGFLIHRDKANTTLGIQMNKM